MFNPHSHTIIPPRRGFTAKVKPRFTIVPGMESKDYAAVCRHLAMIESGGTITGPEPNFWTEWVEANNLTDVILNAIESHALHAPYLEAQAILNSGTVIGSPSRFTRPPPPPTSPYHGRERVPPHRGGPYTRRGVRGRNKYRNVGTRPTERHTDNAGPSGGTPTPTPTPYPFANTDNAPIDPNNLFVNAEYVPSVAPPNFVTPASPSLSSTIGHMNDLSMATLQTEHSVDTTEGAAEASSSAPKND